MKNNIIFINVCLIIILLFGITIGCYQAIINPLTSDTVNPGLYAHDFWKGNQQFFVPVNDPYPIDYLISVITVPLFDYGAHAVVVEGIIVYLIIILLAFLIVKHLSGTTAGLVVAAIISNSPYQSLQYLVSPVYHGTTIMIILGIILVYYIIEDIIKLGVIAFLMMLGALNDSLIVPIFIVPFILLNLIKYKEKNSWIMILASIAGLAVFMFKQGSLWPNGLYLVNVGGITNIIGANLQPSMIPQYVFSLVNMSGGILIILIILGLILAWNHRESRDLVFLCIMGGICMFFGFVFMYSSGGDLGRWLYPIPIMGMLAISTGIKDKKTMAYLIVPVIIFLLLTTNTIRITVEDHNINEKDYELITYLHSINVTHAYANYWASNLLDYLDPSQTLRIAPVEPVNGSIQYLYLQSSMDWTKWGWPTNNSPTIDNDPVLIVYTPGDPLYEYAQTINKNTPPIATYSYKNYDVPGCASDTIIIYKYNTTIPAWPIESFQQFQSQGVKPV